MDIIKNATTYIWRRIRDATAVKRSMTPAGTRQKR